jgi:hypothetical protein
MESVARIVAATVFTMAGGTDRLLIARLIGKEAQPAQALAVNAFFATTVTPLVTERVITFAGIRVAEFAIRHRASVTIG